MAFIIHLYDRNQGNPSLEMILRRIGYDVIGTDDSNYALNVLSRIPVDLLLLDAESAEGAAMQVLDAVRMDPQSDEVRAIVVAPQEDPTILQSAKALGADGLLVRTRDTLEQLLPMIQQQVPHAPASWQVFASRVQHSR